MERQDYIDQINDLKATVKRLLDIIDTLKQTLDSVTASNKRNEELVVKLTAQVGQLQKMIKNLEDKNRRHNKHTFGKSSLKKNKRAEEVKDYLRLARGDEWSLALPLVPKVSRIRTMSQ